MLNTFEVQDSNTQNGDVSLTYNIGIREEEEEEQEEFELEYRSADERVRSAFKNLITKLKTNPNTNFEQVCQLKLKGLLLGGRKTDSVLLASKEVHNKLLSKP